MTVAGGQADLFAHRPGTAGEATKRHFVARIPAGSVIPPVPAGPLAIEAVALPGATLRDVPRGTAGREPGRRGSTRRCWPSRTRSGPAAARATRRCLQPHQILSAAAGTALMGNSQVWWLRIVGGAVRVNGRGLGGTGRRRPDRAVRPGLDRGGAGLHHRDAEQHGPACRRGCSRARSPPTCGGCSTSSTSASPSATRRSSRRSPRARRPTTPWSATRRRRRSAPSACAPPRPPRYRRGAGAAVPAHHGAAGGAGRRAAAAGLAEPARPQPAARQRRGGRPRRRPQLGPAPARRRAVRRLAPPGRGAADRMAAAGRGRRRGGPGRRAGLPPRPLPLVDPFTGAATPPEPGRRAGPAPGGDPGPGPAAGRERDRRRPQARDGGRVAGCPRPADRRGGRGLPRAGGTAGHRGGPRPDSGELVVHERAAAAADRRSSWPRCWPRSRPSRRTCTCCGWRGGSRTARSSRCGTA